VNSQVNQIIVTAAVGKLTVKEFLTLHGVPCLVDRFASAQRVQLARAAEDDPTEGREAIRCQVAEL
jgi:hypothetical protein